MSHLSLAVLTLAAALIGTPLLLGTPAHAAATPEQRCQKARLAAAGKYAQCDAKALANFHSGGTTDKLEAALSTCRVKYTDTWLKLQKKAVGTGSTCDAPRFEVGAFGEAVIDNLTGLEWRKKDDGGGIHDKDNLYRWNSPSSEIDDAFIDFLKPFNGGCVLGECANWRLPTRAELQTILSEPHPCTTSPCIDAIFGPTIGGFYWTATEHASDDSLAWAVSFLNGFVAVGAPTGDKVNGANHVRAVRGGL